MAQIDGLCRAVGVEEAAVITTVADKQARKESYALLAQAARLVRTADDVAFAAG